jgi:hypothetical protein
MTMKAKTLLNWAIALFVVVFLAVFIFGPDESLNVVSNVIILGLVGTVLVGLILVRIALYLTDQYSPNQTPRWH